MKPCSKLLTLAAPFRTDELSSVSEYLYQSIIFAESHSELAELSERLALDEMHHFKMLSEFIHSCGGDISLNMRLKTPLYHIRDERSALSVMLENMKSERESSAKYRKIASATGDPRTAKLFHALADDEEMHISLLSELADKIRCNYM